MGNYDNKWTYNNILAKSDEELVPVLAYNLVNWKNDCIKNSLGFVAFPKDKTAIAIDAFNKETNAYLEGTRKKRCLISDGKGELIICPAKKNAITASIRVSQIIWLLDAYRMISS